MKLLFSIFLFLTSHSIAAQQQPQPTHAESTTGKTAASYTLFSEARATELVVETRKFLSEPLTVAAANKLTSRIMQTSKDSEPYYMAALSASTENPRLTAALEAFRAEELRLPRKLGNTDEKQLDDAISSLVKLGNEVRALAGN